jgi:mono/diheme cytochrome c family protein
MLAEINTTAIALMVLGGLLAIVSIVALVLRHRAKHHDGPEIPITMRPGPSDSALETPVLQRLQGWAVIMVVFVVAWFPLQWLLEPGRNLAQEEDLKTLAIARGELAVEEFTEENQLGVGCVRCHGPELKGGTAIIVNGEYRYPPDLTTVCGRLTLEEIETTIYEGRVDAGMPSWSIRYEGALTDQQINDIVNYIVHINEETVPFEQNKCTNPDAGTETPAAEASPAADEGAA